MLCVHWGIMQLYNLVLFHVIFTLEPRLMEQLFSEVNRWQTEKRHGEPTSWLLKFPLGIHPSAHILLVTACHMVKSAISGAEEGAFYGRAPAYLAEQ